MRLIQLICTSVIFSFLLAACGGGGTLEQGGGGGAGQTPTYALAIEVYDSSGNPTREVSQSASVEVIATLRSNNVPQPNQIVSFELSGNVGVLSPAEGTARTNENGQARITLLAGQVPGAGAVTASFTNNNQTFSSPAFAFDSTGDLSSSVSLNLRVLNEANQELRNLSHQAPGVMEATLLIDGQPSPFQIVRFFAEFSGVINPASGLAMTDEHGVARVDLLAGTVESAGQAYAEFVSTNNISVRSNVFTYNSQGDAPALGESQGFLVSLDLLNSNSLESTNEVNALNPGLVRTRVTDLSNEPVRNKVVTFTSSLGRFRPSLGTALTDNNGFAEIVLSAGTIEGAGTITAQYESVVSAIGFYTQGDEIDSSQVQANVSFRILTNCQSGFRATRDPALCTESSGISADNPGVLFVRVLRDGSSVPLSQVLVSAQTTLGAISPSSSTAITDSNGVALLDLLAGRDVGAGEVTITSVNRSATKAFDIGAAQVTVAVSSGLATGESLAAGSTTIVQVEIFNTLNELYLPPLDVELTSNCVRSGQSVIDNVVTTVGGVATATYRADGCVGDDLITATVVTGGDSVIGSVTIPVSAANIGALEFISASTDYLALKGTGGQNRVETAVVQFRLIDANGNPVSGETVNFRLSTDVGGLSIEPIVALTNNDGFVQTVIRSGTVPTPVRVIATFSDDIQVIQAPSDNLVVSTGIADQNSFSLSRESFNVRGLNYDGTEVAVTVFLADHFNNPVPNGTAVSFIAEGGSIEPSCLTDNGRCSVVWRSQNPRPFTDPSYQNTILHKCHAGQPCPRGIVNNDLSVDYPLGGRATILAYAIGEESFADRNGNGRFDPDDFVTAYDLGEAFIDHNENGNFDGTPCIGGDPLDPCLPENSLGGEFEEFIDFNGNGVFDGPNGLYNGLLCSVEQDLAGVCSRELVNVFQNAVIVMSGSEAFMRVVTFANDCTAIPGVIASVVRANSDPTSPILAEGGQQMCDVQSIDLSVGAASSVFMRLYISDVYNNPMPVGTEVVISADNGILVGTNEYTFPNITSRIPVSLEFGITREPSAGGNQKELGLISFKVTSPSGLVSTATIPVTDDR